VAAVIENIFVIGGALPVNSGSGFQPPLKKVLGFVIQHLRMHVDGLQVKTCSLSCS